MILSFLIVLVHFFRIKNLKFYYFVMKNLPYYVPNFFLIAFYFTYKKFISRNIENIKERFIRLLIPYIGWPIIFWLRNNYLYYRYKKRGKIKFKLFYYQLLIGNVLATVFWYLFNLLFISLLFVIIIFLSNRHYMLILFIITLLSYIFINSQYGKIFFNYYKYVPGFISIYRIPNMILYSFTGFFISSIDIIRKLYKYRFVVLIVSAIFIFINIYKYNINKIIFYYRPIIIDLVILNSFVFFSLIPLDKINNHIIYYILNQITNYTGGVYYLHITVGNIYKQYINIKKMNIKKCILVYLICYVICLINSNIFRKSKIKYLFN